ncbi:hypothetical protein HDU93_007034 [Gonapodya sp. JEL0774]|nr:hypothetical protein HDU93_007034 [Gonapodya sp. JEL0774]
MPNNKVKSLGHLLKPKKKANQKPAPNSSSTEPRRSTSTGPTMSISNSHPDSRKQIQLRRATLRQERIHASRGETDAKRVGVIDRILWFKFACPLVADEAEDLERARRKDAEPGEEGDGDDGDAMEAEVEESSVGAEVGAGRGDGSAGGTEGESVAVKTADMDTESASADKGVETATVAEKSSSASTFVFTKADFHELIDLYLRRHDDDIAQHEAKSSGLHRTKTKSARIDMMEAMRKKEFSEYEGKGGLGGFAIAAILNIGNGVAVTHGLRHHLPWNPIYAEVPDLMDAKNRHVLARWNGDFNSIGRIKMVRMRSPLA